MMSDWSRITLILITTFTAYWLIALYLDTNTNLKSQAIISLSAWAFLGSALLFSPWQERVKTALGPVNSEGL